MYNARPTRTVSTRSVHRWAPLAFVALATLNCAGSAGPDAKLLARRITPVSSELPRVEGPEWIGFTAHYRWRLVVSDDAGTFAAALVTQLREFTSREISPRHWRFTRLAPGDTYRLDVELTEAGQTTTALCTYTAQPD